MRQPVSLNFGRTARVENAYGRSIVVDVVSMPARSRFRSVAQHVVYWPAVLALAFTASLLPGPDPRGEPIEQASPPPASPDPLETRTHLSEALRSSVRAVVVMPGESPANDSVTGTYGKDTPGLVGGMNAGSRAGVISREVGGVNVNFPIPILTIPGAILGGLTGKTRREIQDFRDALTEDLARSASQPLSNDGLALDVYRSLRRLPDLDSKLLAPSTALPDGTDAILYVSVKDVGIDVQGKEAILRTSAEATLRRVEDGGDLYERVIVYEDRDTLGNWTKNDNALWRDYANFARHYLGREISAEVFGRVDLRHELVPRASDTVKAKKKDVWAGESRITAPTLAWELTLLGGDPYGDWAGRIDESLTYYELEIYDAHRLVYAAQQIPATAHRLQQELDDCKSYRWSVRPSYRVADDVKYGEWMRVRPGDQSARPGGNIGRKASLAPAYTQDFASLKIACGRR